MMRTLNEILCESSARHQHLCPRQVLGARMALYASDLLGLGLPRRDKRLLVISETDGCTVDGLIAATGCHIGGRTLRILDFGKVAATFTDTLSGDTIRIIPRLETRQTAWGYFPRAKNRWEAMLRGYQVMPVSELFTATPVRLNTPISEIIGAPGKKAVCKKCGEEIINGREVLESDLVLCRGCAGSNYYQIPPVESINLDQKLQTKPQFI